MSALINPTFWIAAGALALVIRNVSGQHRAAGLAGYARLLSHPLALLVIGVLAAANVTARVSMALLAPGDFAGEIAAARSFSRTGELYSRETVLVEPLGPLASAMVPYVPARLQHAAATRRALALAAQAHPPTLLLAAVPGVRRFGPEGAYLTLAILSLAAAAWTALVLVRECAPGLAAHIGALCLLLLVAWQPALAAVRDGQVSVILASLVISGWAALRRGRRVRAGVWLGIATALKLYPGLVLLATIQRSRRTVAVAGAIVLAGAAAASATAGRVVWSDYATALSQVLAAHLSSPANLSIAARLGPLAHAPVGRAIYLISALLLIGLTMRCGVDGDSDERGPAITRFDVCFARMCCLSVVLSPIAWHHYTFVLALPIAVVATQVWQSGRRPILAALLLCTVWLCLPVTVEWTVRAQSARALGLVLSHTVPALGLWGLLAFASAPVRPAPATA